MMMMIRLGHKQNKKSVLVIMVPRGANCGCFTV
jgi:hypothetical protein